jgi:hypothetical protein
VAKARSEEAVIAFKFLGPGRTSLFTGFEWPAEGGAMSTAAGPIEPCRRGFHVCRAAQLPYWIGEALWVVQIGGTIVEGRDAVVASRARLLREVTAWREGRASEMAAACVERAAAIVAAARARPRHAARGFLAEADSFARAGEVAAAAHSAACAVASLAPATNQHRAYRRERAWQARWLSLSLGLEDARRA